MPCGFWRRSGGIKAQKKKRGSTSGTRQEVAIYHFSEVTNVALRLSPCFLFLYLLFFLILILQRPCCLNRLPDLFLKECTLSRLLLSSCFYTSFFFFKLTVKFHFPNKKKKKAFLFSLYSSEVCALHFNLMGSLNVLLFLFCFFVPL